MSGGCMNYLYIKEVPDLLTADSVADMEITEALLLSKGYKDVAKDVRRLIEYINSAENRIEVLHKQLSSVFHAAEWYLDGDYGNETLARVVEKYRRGDGDE